MTRLLLTTIPFFREVIVSSFSCEHCGWSNTEVQSAGRIQDQGVRYTLTVRAAEVRAARSRPAGPRAGRAGSPRSGRAAVAPAGPPARSKSLPCVYKTHFLLTKGGWRCQLTRRDL